MIDRTVRRLLETGDITPEHLQYALEEQLITNQSIVKIIVNRGYITEARIKDALEIYEYEDIDARSIDISSAVIKMLPLHLIRNNHVFPLKFENNQFVLGMVDPKDLITKDTVSMFLGKTIVLQRFKISEEDYQYLLSKYVHLFAENKETDVIITETNSNESHSHDSKEEAKADPILSIPIEKIISRVLDNALKKRASQITVEPGYENIRIRFKIDDTYYEEARLPRKMYDNFLNYVKQLGGIQNNDKSFHYSGHFKYTDTHDKKEINIVLNGIKTIQGDKLILRPGYPIPDLKSLFYYPELYNYLNKVTGKNKGLILVIGSAGSGKSTTLYSLLQHKISTKHQLMTIESPVKYVFENYVSQVEIKNDKDVELSELVYEVSKHNPDILMVQEIKNEVWSSLIEELALSGMLVLTGMRAYNVLSAFKKLKRMSFPNFASI
ncbi:MAG: Flp pilus assembly complex ATPase component TadA, partial [Candidatus Sericytochromatia bacterium]|nr:Flp pilus assembly complex ATPase component TadA [Candidatus Sericytochromatia bacterium]